MEEQVGLGSDIASSSEPPFYYVSGIFIALNKREFLLTYHASAMRKR